MDNKDIINSEIKILELVEQKLGHIWKCMDVVQDSNDVSMEAYIIKKPVPVFVRIVFYNHVAPTDMSCQFIIGDEIHYQFMQKFDLNTMEYTKGHISDIIVEKLEENVSL